MKTAPFDLQKARNSHPLITENGEKIIAISITGNSKYPDIRIVLDSDNDRTWLYNFEGKLVNCETYNPLLLLIEDDKKTESKNLNHTLKYIENIYSKLSNSLDMISNLEERVTQIELSRVVIESLKNNNHFIKGFCDGLSERVKELESRFYPENKHNKPTKCKHGTILYGKCINCEREKSTVGFQLKCEKLSFIEAYTFVFDSNFKCRRKIWPKECDDFSQENSKRKVIIFDYSDFIANDWYCVDITNCNSNDNKINVKS
jgi:hypothetical protein